MSWFSASASSTEFGCAIPQFAVECLEGGIVGVLRLLVHHLEKHRLQHRLPLIVVRQRLCTGLPLYQKLDAPTHPVRLNDAYYGSDVVQELRKGIVYVFSLGNGEHATITVQGCLDGLDGSGSPG